MVTKRPSHCKISAPVLLLFLLLIPSPPPADAIPLAQWRTLFSLSSSLMHRVASARASRGDFSGADRAKKIAEKLQGGYAFWGGIWRFGWDYARNYAWRDFLLRRPPTDTFNAVSDMNELLKALGELARMDSQKDRANWVLRNYQRVLAVSKSLLGRLLTVFSRSGPLHEMVLILLKEAEGDLLRDCMELGANDLKGLLQVAKDIALQFSMSSSGAGHSSGDL